MSAIPTKSRNLLGLTFARLTVESYAGQNKHGSHMWNCQCECGKTGVFKGTNLRSGHTRSCGCWSRELHRVCNSIHGHTSVNGCSPEYYAWKNLRSRCLRPAGKSYKYYGARGIEVFSGWRNSFEAFLHHVGKRPSPLHSLDRINNDLGYFPGNVRWAIREVQSNNRRNNVRVTIHGRTQTVSQWCDETGVNRTTAYGRIRRGWEPILAVTTPSTRGDP